MRRHVDLIKRMRLRWFGIGVLFGVGVALLLLVNSISNYFFVSRRVLLEQVRRELSRQVATLDQQIQQSRPKSTQEMASLLEAAVSQSEERIASILIRDGSGAILAKAGLPLGPTFEMEFIRAQFHSRQPASRIRQTFDGEVVVEAFPIRLPMAIGPAVFPAGEVRPAQAGEGVGRPFPRFAVIEMALRLRPAEGALWPIQRNLLINCSAALALLISLTVMAFRFRSYLKGKELEREVEIARQVQQDLLPSPNLLPRQFDLAVECAPAAQLGGDFYDIFPAKESGAAFVLGDVCGKGIPAALLMGVLHGAVRSSAWTGSAEQHEEATRQINRLLFEHSASARFASMFWSYFDPRTELLHYVNAGHLPPLLFRATEEGFGAPMRLNDGGPVLGLLPAARFRQGAVRLGPGDILVLYSDGILEAADREGRQFGEERLAEAVTGGGARQSPRTAAEIQQRILSAVRAFSGTTVPDDDRTLFVIRYQGAANARRVQNLMTIGA